MLALKAAGLRVPDGAPESHKALADHALGRICEVMNEQVSPFASHAVLTAARAVREEVCGPLKQKFEHSGPDGKPLQIVINKLPMPSEGET